MNIGLDIMGGDNAPDATIRGAILAYEDIPSTDRLFLFGDEEIIRTGLQKEGADPNNFEIIHAPDMIGMSEQPIKAFTQKPHSSISVGFHYLKEGKIDAFKRREQWCNGSRIHVQYRNDTWDHQAMHNCGTPEREW